MAPKSLFFLSDGMNLLGWPLLKVYITGVLFSELLTARLLNWCPATSVFFSTKKKKASPPLFKTQTIPPQKKHKKYAEKNLKRKKRAMEYIRKYEKVIANR